MNRWDFTNFNYYSFVYIFAYKLISYNSFNARTHQLNNTNSNTIRFDSHTVVHTRSLGVSVCTFGFGLTQYFYQCSSRFRSLKCFCIFRRLLRFCRHARSDPLPLSVCCGLTPKRNSARNLLRCVAHRTANAQTKQIRSLTGIVANLV